MERDYRYPGVINHTLFDNTLEMIFLFEESGEIIYANTTALKKLEYDVKSMPLHMNDVFPNGYVNGESYLKMLEHVGGDVMDLTIYRRNRTCFRVEAKVCKDYDFPRFYVCMANDVSKQDYLQKELAKTTRELDEGTKVKTEFVANVTHELRTPVNGILGNTTDLLENETDKHKQRILRLIERGCREMNQLINNILDFSKLEAGKFTLESRKICMRDMIDYVKANHTPRIMEKGLDFFVTVTPEVPKYVIGDELRIVQILNNLLSNALKFTNTGKIMLEVVKTAQVNDKVELFFIVLDSGIGIDSASQDKLFKSFSQVDASISRKYGGTGLGLNICKQLVESMGGSISVESEINKGSMFTFSIWLGIPEEEIQTPTENKDLHLVLQQMMNDYQNTHTSEVDTYGTQRNLEEINKIMSKLVLGIELENWEKAEMFVGMIKKMTETAPKEVKNAMLKMKMAVQKEDYEKAMIAYDALKTIMEV